MSTDLEKMKAFLDAKKKKENEEHHDRGAKKLGNPQKAFNSKKTGGSLTKKG